jgi:hypothetical protein
VCRAAERGCAARPHTPVRGAWLTIPMLLGPAPNSTWSGRRSSRRQVETMSNADVCRQLLDIADRYEELADGIERPVVAAIAPDAREARPFGKRMIRFITIGR